MDSITVAIESFLRQEEVKYEPTEFSGVFKFGFVGENGCFRGYVAVDENNRTVRVRSLAPVIVSPAKTLEVADLLTRINQRLSIAAFSLNAKAGAIACQVSIVHGKSGVGDDVLRHLLYANWQLIDAYFPAINAVVFGDIAANQAIERMEQRAQSNHPGYRNGPESLSGRLECCLGDSTN